MMPEIERPVWLMEETGFGSEPAEGEYSEVLRGPDDARDCLRKYLVRGFAVIHHHGRPVVRRKEGV
jgi:hypothetical protein